MSAPDRPTREQVDEYLDYADEHFMALSPVGQLATEVRALRAELDAARVASEQIAEWRAAEHAELVRLRAVQTAARVYVAGGLHDEFMAALGVPGYGDTDGLVARTPQPSDPADNAQVGDQLGQAWVDAQEAVADGGCRALMPRPEGARWMCTRSAHPGRQHVATIGGKVVAVSPSDPLPAVPDGEDARDLAKIRRITGIHPDAPRGELLGEVERLVQNDDYCTETHGPTDGEEVPARLDAAAEALDGEGIGGATALRDFATGLRFASPDVRAAVAAALARPTERER